MSKEKTAVDLQKEVHEFKETLKGKTSAELQKMEDDLIAESDKITEEASKTEFELPAKGYKEAADAIHMLLEKQTVDWQFALALASMYEFFDTKRPEKIPFPLMDALLRNLSQQQYKGYAEWSAVATINKYFAPLREAYSGITEKIYMNAEKHVAVTQQMQMGTEAQAKPIN